MGACILHMCVCMRMCIHVHVLLSYISAIDPVCICKTKKTGIHTYAHTYIHACTHKINEYSDKVPCVWAPLHQSVLGRHMCMHACIHTDIHRSTLVLNLISIPTGAFLSCRPCRSTSPFDELMASGVCVCVCVWVLTN